MIDTAIPNPTAPAREALVGWGAGLLLLGLGFVGAGAGPEGAPIALAGLLNTIYGIHTFGRLGPDDEEADAERVADAKRSTAAWTGGLTALAGVLVAIDHHYGMSRVFGTPSDLWQVTAYGLAAIGAVRVARALRKKSEPESAGAPPARPKRARVEKRRRMDKSRAP